MLPISSNWDIGGGLGARGARRRAAAPAKTARRGGAVDSLVKFYK